MKRKSILLFLCSTFLIFADCSSSDDSNNCNANATILADQPFSEINTENYTITSVALNENCLDITVSSSGCDSNNWTMNLFGANTNSAQRNLKVQLINQELCLAVFQKTVSFNLIPLRIAGQHQITLNIEGWDEDVIYQY
jgi:hypothetical protein